jgi:predicted DNA-binding transcriptional regulator YafY
VPRNAEVIRQWSVLRTVEGARGSGVTIDDLAKSTGVTTRTIRRDLHALQEAGFPLFDDRTNDDGRTRWRLSGQALKGLASGLTLSELCALHFSRSLVESLSGAPFLRDVERAFEKVTSGLTPHMRQFLDQLPRVIAAKRDPVRRLAASDAAPHRTIVARALEATLQLRQATITYDSTSSERTKTYLVHPYRLVHAEGGLYLIAFVPEYGEVRTFALERIRSLSLKDERFSPIKEQEEAAFPHSLGVHSGPPERVEVEFDPAVASYVSSRQWHPSQTIAGGTSGTPLRLTLNVCLDRALRAWILGFGASARVIAPARLRDAIAGEIEKARTRYARDVPARTAPSRARRRSR